MKTYKLTRPFDDGTVVHPRGTIMKLEKAPKSAKVITAEEIAAQQVATSDAEDVVKTAERAAFKAELLAELAEEGGKNDDYVAKLQSEQEALKKELADLKEALAKNLPKADDAVAEAEAANAAAAATVTGGVDNDGKPLKDATKAKPPVQKASGK